MSGKAGSKTCAKVTSSQRAKMPAISDEMKRLSAMLEQELSTWPDVTVRPMFGMLGLYRHGVIFAALPRTRALHSGNSIIFKFDPMPRELLDRAKKDARV